MARCTKVNRKGQRCHLPWDHLSPLHVYTRLAEKGRRSVREADTIDAFRIAVRDKARGLCQAWGLYSASDEPLCHGVQHRGIEAHHILPRSRGGLHVLENGVWLCQFAHQWVHAHPRDAARLGLLTLREVSTEQ